MMLGLRCPTCFFVDLGYGLHVLIPASMHYMRWRNFTVIKFLNHVFTSTMDGESFVLDVCF